MEKFQLWILVEISLLLMLFKLFEESSTVSATMTFILVEVSLSLSLLVGFLVDSFFLFEVFCLGKLGLFPFWFWVFRMFEGVESSLMIGVMVIYKIIPLVLCFLFVPASALYPLVIFNSLVFFSLLVSVSSMTSTLSILVIFSTGWLVSSFVSGSTILAAFFVTYFFMLWFLLMGEKEGNMNNTLLLLYGGLPPFFSFFAKLMILTTSSVSLVVVFIPLFLGLTMIFVLSSIVGSWKNLFFSSLVGVLFMFLCR